jgi:hypothetical protein
MGVAENSVDLDALSAYDRRVWQEIRRWENSPARRKVLPAKARQTVSRVGETAADAWKSVPGAIQIDEVVERVLAGGNQAVTDAVAASLRRERILEAVRSTGNPVMELSDLQDLDLQVLDGVCPSLNQRYAAASAATGAGAGFVAGGGTAAIAGTGGVAAAPGALAIGGALAADVVATIALAARVVSHYAGYYGYDARTEEEKAVILAIIGVGVVGEGAAKQAAMLHVRQVAMMVARRAAWKELGEEAIVVAIQALFAKLAVNLTKTKLAQALPIAGIAIGGGFNYVLMRKVGTAASYAYRERFLIEKYGLDSATDAPDLNDILGPSGELEDPSS